MGGGRTLGVIHYELRVFGDKGADPELLGGGGARNDYKPPGYNKWGKNYSKYGYRKSGIKANTGRKLSQDVGAQNFFKGWGWSSPCQTYKSQKAPIWATTKSGKFPNFFGTPGWGLPGTAWADKILNSQKAIDSMRWGPAYVAPGTSSNNWKAYTWMPPRSLGRQPITYFRLWEDYRQKFSECKAKRCSFTPGYYYSQVYPLASFTAILDADGYIYNLYG
eukprot:gene13987-14102_t